MLAPGSILPPASMQSSGRAFEFSPLSFSLSHYWFFDGFSVRMFEGVFYTSEFRSGIKKTVMTQAPEG